MGGGRIEGEENEQFIDVGMEDPVDEADAW